MFKNIVRGLRAAGVGFVAAIVYMLIRHFYVTALTAWLIVGQYLDGIGMTPYLTIALALAFFAIYDQLSAISSSLRAIRVRPTEIHSHITLNGDITQVPLQPEAGEERANGEFAQG